MWTDGQITVLKLARDFFLTDQRLLANWLCEKIKKSVGGVVYIDLHNHVCCQAGYDFSMNSKDNW